ncbi:fumarylacetoacetate hydrolase family protein [Candidatus Poribacteria bacterium]|jgi:2,4-didehydro-3-deoxy-L-rhamnonate hydrolase|nr:fumarylacetoacetate hydrolase family protein [Candidatus Poribacteria bacterium]MBT5531491.1 fumarylacetoacetate hydrolase family protein [Candidatus Poribacteria bacterium]MBT5713545.1 fumarylacetoacetate hydrolase family protein [Candidatus Poribacteria bacterium]MBT7100646.1 fumarylacetoacetate hydrolase family protein [Candidatus Poribacteria bacterium]MBT7808589.1 fumarylacetoacetate hydrolase family protein [Candidatus Poribacteria bacterium]
MKLVSFRADGGPRLGLSVGDHVVDVAATYSANFAGDGTALATMRAFLNAGPPALEAAQQVHALAGESPDKATTTDAPLTAPVPDPPKLLCLAGNYAEHIREGGGIALEKEQTTPRVFMKPPSTTIVGPGDAIVIPRNAGWIDWEAELAIVMGRGGRFIDASDALSYVAGYTIVNDVSERQFVIDKDREPRDGDSWFDWLNGKWFDTFAPQGPCLVTTDEIRDPDNLRIALRVNGASKQDSSTAHMVFTCAELIEWVSRNITLEPGDIISTGTPSGVGKARGEHLNPGDTVEVEIEGIGVLSNPVTREE